MKKIILLLAGLIIVLLMIVAFNTFRFKSQQPGALGQRLNFPADSSVISHLAGALRIPTISYDTDSLNDYTAFDSLYRFFRSAYPLTFQSLTETSINQYSLLLHWKSVSDQKPVILYAHLDVVPPGDTMHSNWQHPPFAGVTDDKFVYGRGAIDDKGSAIAILEAIEMLLREGFSPSRDIYIAFGHDEEDTGLKGARHIAAHLKSRNVFAEFLLDEGGLIAVDMVPFVKAPVALVATSEKGYMSVELSVSGDGGHSSYPSSLPPIERIARAISTINSHPFESRMTQSLENFLDYAGPEMEMPYRAIFANRWLFRNVIFSEYEKLNSANAMIRTTAVATVIDGGEKENVIPSAVRAVVNIRLLPGDHSSDVANKIRELINDTSVAVKIIGTTSEPSAVSSIESDGFRLLQETIKDVFPDVVITPSLMIGQTDSRHFKDVTANIYRFLPVRMNEEILDGFHGADEKVGISELMESVAFYKSLLKRL